MTRLRSWAATASLVLAAGQSLAVGYLLVLLLAAASARSEASASVRGRRPRIVVLTPAHDEEAGLAATLASLAGIDYPADRHDIVVIADNCADDTAGVACRAGVGVYERHEPLARGKGQALGWGLPRLLRDDPDLDAIVVVDADCQVSPNLLEAVAARMQSGARAVQVQYTADNPAESPSAALRFAGFALMNAVRPRGKRRLGLSCGLFGTGMAFSRSLLEDLPWRAGSLAEDAEYHLELVAAGERVEFVTEAWVRSPMPTSSATSEEQQLRWESGKWHLLRGPVPRILAAGVRHRDVGRIHAGAEHAIPPLSLLAAASGPAAIVGLTLGSRLTVRLVLANTVGLVAFVLGGLALFGAPASAYRALLGAPALAVRKASLYAAIVRGRGARSWVRTGREAPS